VTLSACQPCADGNRKCLRRRPEDDHVGCEAERAGERDAAVEILGRLLAIPIDLGAAALTLDPAWAPLRGHPGFERLIAASKRP
jgi:hypothetical protein